MSSYFKGHTRERVFDALAPPTSVLALAAWAAQLTCWRSGRRRLPRVGAPHQVGVDSNPRRGAAAGSLADTEVLEVASRGREGPMGPAAINLVRSTPVVDPRAEHGSDRRPRGTQTTESTRFGIMLKIDWRRTASATSRSTRKRSTSHC